jgi:hypothetical protein
MSADAGPPARPARTLEEERERTIQELTRHFSRDHLEVEELERRLDSAIAAPDRGALDALVRDLPALPVEAELRPPEPAATATDAPRLEPGVTPRENGYVLALLGGSRREGTWVPPRELRVLAAMGGVELDFRQARFGAPVTDVEVLAVMGGVHIVVPPGIRVEAHGLGIMGGFDHRQVEPVTDPGAPVLRVRGLAVMGGVHVEEREPGESAGEARRRLGRARRDRRRLGGS